MCDIIPDMKEAILYKKILGGVKCQACMWQCKMRPGQSGVCGMRQNIDNKLYSLTYGRATAVNVDPMEKKPLYHFLPGRKVFSIGSVGCNFSCQFCQNFDISQTGIIKKTTVEIEKLTESISPEEVLSYCINHHLPSVAFTYNEPAIWSEYAVDVMKLLKPHHIKGIFVSNGYFTDEAIKFIDPYIDAFNIDLKGFSDKFYYQICGARLNPVLQNIKKIWQLGKWLEITTLLVPGENDSEDELKAMADFIVGISADIPWHISSFYPAYQMMGRAPTPTKTMIKAYEIGKNAGLKYVYLGNINHPDYGLTHCPACTKLLISRNGYEVLDFHIQDNSCSKCGEIIPGIWQ